MRTLIKKCPHICEMLDNKDRTALHLAVESEKVSTVKFLLQAWAFEYLLNKLDKEGNTPLHVAAIKGHYVRLCNFKEFSQSRFPSLTLTGLDRV